MRKNKTVPNKEVDMTSIADVSVCIQTASRVDPLDAFLVRGGRADHPLSTPRKASFLPSRGLVRLPAAASGTTRSSTFSPCSSAMPSAANARWRRSMSGSCLLRSPSWPCSTARDCPPARRSRAFLRASPGGRRSLAHALSRRSARAPSGQRATHRQACGSSRQRTCGL